MKSHKVDENISFDIFHEIGLEFGILLIYRNLLSFNLMFYLNVFDSIKFKFCLIVHRVGMIGWHWNTFLISSMTIHDSNILIKMFSIDLHHNDWLKVLVNSTAN